MKIIVDTDRCITGLQPLLSQVIRRREEIVQKISFTKRDFPDHLIIPLGRLRIKLQRQPDCGKRSKRIIQAYLNGASNCYVDIRPW